jgi:hypothetical protein
MAKKKGGLGRIFGAITGSPYERLLKQVEKLVKENSGNEAKLAKHLKKLVQIVSQNFKEENIDEEEHDLIIEAIEDADPNGRTFPKLSEEEDAFYSGDVPDAPELKRDKRKNLDDLMTASGKEFVGSYGRDEFDEFKARMTDEFYAESDEAIAAGDHQSEIRTEHRVFAGAEDDIDDIKKKFAEESGLVNPDEEEEDEEGYSVDENGVEWFEDEDGYWWYRDPGQDDWQAYDE